MELGLRHLQILVTVRDLTSISSAAAALGISQPALSAQIGRIEKALGLQVFHRSPQGMRPTVMGEQALARAEVLLQDYRRMLDDIADLTSERRTLRMSANRSRFFAAFLAGLVEALPSYEVVPFTSMSTTVIERLLESDQIDLAVVGVHRGYDDVLLPALREAVIVDAEPFLVAMSDKHRLAREPEVRLADLGDDNWLLPPGRPDGTFAALRDSFAMCGIQPRSPLGHQPLTDYAPWVAAGHAVALALPATPPLPGVVLRPLKGRPIVGTRLLRWHPDRLTEEEAELCADVARRVYLEDLAQTAHDQPWWNETPHLRPSVGGHSSGASHPGVPTPRGQAASKAPTSPVG